MTQDRPLLRPHHVALFGVLFVVLLGSSFSLAQPSPDNFKSCNHECLVGISDDYVAHMLAHKPAGLPVALNANIRENTAPVKLDATVWNKITAVKAHQTFADPTTGQVSFRGAVEYDGKLASLAVRLKVEGKKITEIETVYNPGDRPFDATYLLEPDALFDSPIDPSRRSTREQMIKVVDAYFEAIGTHNPNGASFAKRCERFESGMRMTNNASTDTPEGGAVSCAQSLANLKGQQTVDRRFPIVDAERGVVVGFTFIQHQERTPPQALYMAELFKIVDGQIREIENISHTVAFPPNSGFSN